jgi:hypothetical protein
LAYGGCFSIKNGDMAMDQYLLIPFLGEWTSINELFWCSPGVQGFDPSPYLMGFTGLFKELVVYASYPLVIKHGNRQSTIFHR